MGEDGTFYKGVFLMALVFGTGFGVGYKVKRPALLYSLHHTFPSMIPRLIFLLFPRMIFLLFQYKDTRLKLFSPGKRMANGMVEEKEGEASGEAARDSEGDRTHENQLKLS